MTIGKSILGKKMVRLSPSGCGVGHLLGDVEDGGDDVCLQVVQVGDQLSPAAIPEARVTSEKSQCGISSAPELYLRMP